MRIGSFNWKGDTWGKRSWSSRAKGIAKTIASLDCAIVGINEVMSDGQITSILTRLGKKWSAVKGVSISTRWRNVILYRNDLVKPSWGEPQIIWLSSPAWRYGLVQKFVELSTKKKIIVCSAHFTPTHALSALLGDKAKLEDTKRLLWSLDEYADRKVPVVALGDLGILSESKGKPRDYIRKSAWALGHEKATTKIGLALGTYKPGKIYDLAVSKNLTVSRFEVHKTTFSDHNPIAIEVK